MSVSNIRLWRMHNRILSEIFQTCAWVECTSIFLSVDCSSQALVANAQAVLYFKECLNISL